MSFRQCCSPISVVDKQKTLVVIGNLLILPLNIFYSYGITVFMHITNFAIISQNNLIVYLRSSLFATPQIIFQKIWQTASVNFMGIVWFAIHIYSQN
jgi:hypothetical protein